MVGATQGQNRGNQRLNNLIKSNLLPFIPQNSPSEAQAGEGRGAVRGCGTVAERGRGGGSPRAPRGSCQPAGFYAGAGTVHWDENLKMVSGGHCRMEATGARAQGERGGRRWGGRAVWHSG